MIHELYKVFIIANIPPVNFFVKVTDNIEESQNCKQHLTRMDKKRNITDDIYV